MPARRTFLLLLVGPGLAFAEPARNEMEVTLFVVPEAVWQERFEGQFAEHPALWLRLNGDAAAGLVEQPVDFKFRLVGREPVTQRKGVDKQFAESWQTWGLSPDRPLPEEKVSRFIGTSVELVQKESLASKALRVQMNVEHHLAEPVMHRINYGNAAKGPERDRLSVVYPEFEKVQWQGEISIWREWRLAANLLRPQPAGSGAVPAMRYLIFIKRA